MRRAPSLARLTVLFLALGCARVLHRPADPAGPGTEYAAADDSTADPVVLEFENNNWADVVLYILHDGQTTRFTLVTAAHTGALNVPPHLQGQGGVFRIGLRRVGGRDSFTSPPISTRTGHTIRLTIESDLQRSSVGVW